VTKTTNLQNIHTMFKIKKGNTRVVIILFELLVIKVPNLRFKQVYRLIYDEKITNIFHWRKTKATWRHFVYYFLYGLIANASETLLYHEVSSFKTPKYLTKTFTFLGIVNCQPFQGGNMPSKKELREFIDSLPKDSRDILIKCNPHCFSRENWVLTPDGIKIVDFGISTEPTPFARFLEGLELDHFRSTRNAESDS